jgi:hypothetical protein
LFSTSKRRIVVAKLLDDRARVGQRVGRGIERRNVDDVQQQARALQMPQELMPEAGAFSGAFDEAGDVGDDEALAFRRAHDAQLRRECRERVVGNLRARGGNGANQRGLAGVGQAEQADVGQHLELEMQAPLLARFAGRRLARRAVRARFEVQVAKPALATPGDERARAVAIEIGDELRGVRVGDDGADRHAQHDVVRAVAILVRTTSVFAALRAMDAREAVIDERVDVAIGDGEYAAAAPAVTAVGASTRDVFLAPERRGAVAAIAGNYLDVCFIDEFHDASSFM